MNEFLSSSVGEFVKSFALLVTGFLLGRFTAAARLQARRAKRELRAEKEEERSERRRRRVDGEVKSDMMNKLQELNTIRARILDQLKDDSRISHVNGDTERIYEVASHELRFRENDPRGGRWLIWRENCIPVQAEQVDRCSDVTIPDNVTRFHDAIAVEREMYLVKWRIDSPPG